MDLLLNLVCADHFSGTPLVCICQLFHDWNVISYPSDFVCWRSCIFSFSLNFSHSLFFRLILPVRCALSLKTVIFLCSAYFSSALFMCMYACFCVLVCVCATTWISVWVQDVTPLVANDFIKNGLHWVSTPGLSLIYLSWSPWPPLITLLYGTEAQSPIVRFLRRLNSNKTICDIL